MNLLFLPKLFPRSDVIGGPILIYHRIKNLASMGHRISVIAPACDEKDREDRSLVGYCDDIVLVDCDKERSPQEIEELHERLKRPRFFLSGDGGYNEGVERAFVDALENKSLDAVIGEYSMTGQYIEANRGLFPDATKSIISVHECYTRAHQLRAEKGEHIAPELIKELMEYEFQMYRAADIILSLTREDAETMTRMAPELRDKLRVVPHGVDTEFYTPSGDTRDRDSKNILYLGNFLHQPNVDAVKNFMKHCWQKIKNEVPDAKFHAIGFHPPRELLDLRSDSVIIEEGGDDAAVLQRYRSSDVMVAPIELGTGFRGKLLEAMACGLPVVSTSLGTYGIDPVNEKNMFVADDYEVFSGYVINLLNDRDLRKRVSKEALKLAKRFDHKEAAMKLEKVLKEQVVK